MSEDISHVEIWAHILMSEDVFRGQVGKVFSAENSRWILKVFLNFCPEEEHFQLPPLNNPPDSRRDARASINNHGSRPLSVDGKVLCQWILFFVAGWPPFHADQALVTLFSFLFWTYLCGCSCVIFVYPYSAVAISTICLICCTNKHISIIGNLIFDWVLVVHIT